MTPTLQLCLLVPLAPLVGALAAGLFGRTLGRTGSHAVAILGVLISTLVSALLFWDVVGGHAQIVGSVYTWGRPKA